MPPVKPVSDFRRCGIGIVCPRWVGLRSYGATARGCGRVAEAGSEVVAVDHPDLRMPTRSGCSLLLDP